jgi:hypothetical protein
LRHAKFIALREDKLQNGGPRESVIGKLCLEGDGRVATMCVRFTLTRQDRRELAELLSLDEKDLRN